MKILQVRIYNIPPFDAMTGAAIKFSWNGNQAFQNHCIIRKNETNEIVYDKITDSFKLEHKINLEEAQLANGEWYNAFITVLDKDGKESDLQPLGEPFLCLKTPVFRFTNLVKNQSISSSSYEFSLEYIQENGELLDSWSISVYTKNHTLLSTSGVKYDTDTLRHVISGFTNKNEYLVRAVGTTVNGCALDTGDIPISVTYSVSSIFSMLEPTNLRDIGAIQIKSNIVSSEGHLGKEPGLYLDEESLDLRDNTLTYSEGFRFDKDFSLVLRFYGTEPNQQLLNMQDETGYWNAAVTHRITKNQDRELVSLFELLVTSYGYASVFYSNPLPALSITDEVGLCIVRQNNLYHIETANLTGGESSCF